MHTFAVIFGNCLIWIVPKMFRNPVVLILGWRSGLPRKRDEPCTCHSPLKSCWAQNHLRFIHGFHALCLSLLASKSHSLNEKKNFFEVWIRTGEISQINYFLGQKQSNKIKEGHISPKVGSFSGVRLDKASLIASSEDSPPNQLTTRKQSVAQSFPWAYNTFN